MPLNTVAATTSNTSNTSNATVVTTLIPTQRIYAFGLSRDKIEKAIAHLKVAAIVVKDIDDATMVMTIKNYYRQGSARLRNAEERRLPIYVLRSSTAMQIERQLLDIFFPDQMHRPDEKPSALTTPERDVQDAMLEAEVAINQLLNGERSAVELTPKTASFDDSSTKWRNATTCSRRVAGVSPFGALNFHASTNTEKGYDGIVHHI